MSEQEKIVTPSIEQAPAASPATPELSVSPEHAPEKPQSVNEQAAISAAPATQTPVAAPITPSPRSEKVAEIERILEDDLSEVYFNLPEDKRAPFRVQGEVTAQEIETVLSATKVKVNKIIGLIKKWLLLIPGVNKFFLEQEAKLKTDQIIKLNDKL
jgi:hypothetical protein